MGDATTRLPGSAVDASAEDLIAPLKAILSGVELLPSGQSKGPVRAAFTGETESLNVIQAGATALSKAWAAGLGASVVAIWTSLGAWWGGQESPIKVSVVIAAGVVSAAVAFGIAHIVASDVRGRAAATVAQLQARGNVVDRFLAEAATTQVPASRSGAAGTVIPVSPARSVRWTAKPANEEKGWSLVAVRFDGEDIHYWLMKGASGAWAPVADVEV